MVRMDRCLCAVSGDNTESVQGIWCTEKIIEHCWTTTLSPDASQANVYVSPMSKNGEKECNQQGDISKGHSRVGRE